MIEPSRQEGTLEALRELIRTLRGPHGCPWDKTRSIADMKTYLLEECYETIEAIDQGSLSRLKEELGDLLFHILFISELAEEHGAFSIEDVINVVLQKMIHRHPHVFGSAEARDVETVTHRWSKIKLEEGGPTASLLGDIPRSLPGLHRAYMLGKRASRVGFDWPKASSVLEKISEEYAELKAAIASEHLDRITEEIGDFLFATAHLARLLGVNPEEALQRSNEKFVRRFRTMEASIGSDRKTLAELSPSELDELWNKVKEEEASGS